MDDNIVWSAYERNSFIYSTCKDLKKCPHTDTYNCYCSIYQLVHPKIIAYCGFLCGDIKQSILNKKCYIGFGEICSICTEPIISKKSAWLTPCGHPFHHKCLIENHYYREKNNMTIEYSNEIPCPVCRKGLIDCCIGIDNINRYRDTNNNGLDKLENFWLTIDIKPCLLCYDCNTELGMNKLCRFCNNYRCTGYTDIDDYRYRDDYEK
jgi:hypothetical protein